LHIDKEREMASKAAEMAAKLKSTSKKSDDAKNRVARIKKKALKTGTKATKYAKLLEMMKKTHEKVISAEEGGEKKKTYSLKSVQAGNKELMSMCVALVKDAVECHQTIESQERQIAKLKEDYERLETNLLKDVKLLSTIAWKRDGEAGEKVIYGREAVCEFLNDSPFY
jgi:hypothetical protein